MTRYHAHHEGVTGQFHADDVAAIFTNTGADVEVAWSGQIGHVKPTDLVALGASVIVENVVVNHHVSGGAVGVVQTAGTFDVVGFTAGGHVDELEAVIATDPQEVGANVRNQPRDIVVATVEHAVVFGEGHQPLI